MNTKRRSPLYRSILWLVLFLLWTAALNLIDVQSIGPNASSVGFASFNSAFHRLTGVHMFLYHLTDWLSLIPIFIVIFFACIGLLQLIRRRHLLKVDPDILLLSLYYLIIFAFYLLFEEFPVNHRPILIDGFLEASYPSSTTLLMLTVMPAAIIQIRLRVRSLPIRKTLISATGIFTVLMVLGRTISGVHWATDIIGGILLSASLTEAYTFSVSSLIKRNDRIF